MNNINSLHCKGILSCTKPSGHQSTWQPTQQATHPPTDPACHAPGHPPMEEEKNGR